VIDWGDADFVESSPLQRRQARARPPSSRRFWKKVLVKPSDIHGHGAFAEENILKDDFIIEYTGTLVNEKEADAREALYQANSMDRDYMMCVAENNYVDATIGGSEARFINHSCNPNAISVTEVANGEYHVNIYALRNIPKGEEICMDYMLRSTDPGTQISCSCGAGGCSGRRPINQGSTG